MRRDLADQFDAAFGTAQRRRHQAADGRECNTLWQNDHRPGETCRQVGAQGAPIDQFDPL